MNNNEKNDLENMEIDQNKGKLNKKVKIQNKFLGFNFSVNKNKNPLKILPILWIIGLIAILITIGIIIFFISMPGMVMEKMKKYSEDFGKGLSSKVFGINTGKELSEKSIYETLNYLEEMGYDLNSYGLTNNENTDDIKRNDKLQIVDAESVFLMSYLLSDSYVYTIRNYNKIDVNEILSKLSDGVKDSFNELKNNKWFNGMIKLSFEGNQWEEGEEYISNSVSINDENDLLISTSVGMIKYNLNGWTGRYSVPLEFLLSMHLSTLMPDMLYDIENSFKTTISIILKGSSSEATLVSASLSSLEIFKKQTSSEYASTTQGMCVADHYIVSSMLDGASSGNVVYYVFDINTGKLVDKQYEKNINTHSNSITYNSDEKTIVVAGGQERCFDIFDFDDGKLTYRERIGTSKVINKIVYVADEKKYYLASGKNVYSSSDLKNYKYEFHAQSNGVNNQGMGFDGEYLYLCFSDNDTIGRYGNQYGSNIVDAFDLSGNHINTYVIEDPNFRELEEVDFYNGTMYIAENAMGTHGGNIYKANGVSNSTSSGVQKSYIKSVTDHWYRDIYFVQTGKEFVKYDNSYEALMNERFTLYETDDNGDFVYYILNEDGSIGEKYNGKVGAGFYKNDNGEDVSTTFGDTNQTLVKKALTDEISNIGEDLQWNYENGKWTAYEVGNDGNVVQTGDGQRTETNSKIKKILTQNTYFRYDGSSQTANVISQLRKKYNLGYGELSKEDLEKSIEIDNQTYTVKDVSGQVSLEQDALNAFSMLENEHTLDSDYVYRDFKELIVELGYYKKEDVSEEKPKLLQWIIPTINSYGYPKRELDKRENEYGTMSHSKSDYKALEAISNYGDSDEERVNLDSANEGGTGVENDENVENDNEEINQNISLQSNSQNIDNIVTNDNTYENVGSVADCGYASKDFTASGWEETGKIVKEWSSKININTISNYYSKGNKTEYENFVNNLGGIFSKYAGEEKVGDGTAEALSEAGAYVYGLMGIVGFNYCAYTGSGYDYGRCTTYMNGKYGGKYDAYPNLISSDGYTRHINGHGKLRKILDDCMVNYNFVTCCNYTVDKVMFKAGLFGGEGQPRSSCNSKVLIEKYGGKPVFEVSELHLGDIINCYETTGNNSTNPEDWKGYWHTMYVGEETDDEIVVYETGHDYTNDGNWRKVISKNADKSAVAGQAWAGIHLWDLKNKNEYEGYNGNEEVVSPVTGVLLEYGTYENEQSNVSNEKYRINVDYKYGVDSIALGTITSNVSPSGETSDIPVDKVGYAKILVLDKENYLKLEKSTNNKWKNESLMNNKGKLKDVVNDEDDFSKWSELDKTIYGYKEFLEDYENGGIDGYVVYIDGFKCSLPGDLKDDKTVENDKAIDIDYFKTITEDNVSNTNKQLKSLYEKDEDSKLLSEKQTKKKTAENEIKDKASSSIYDSKNDLIYIKEGTVIGRTITDKELLDDSQYRNGNYGTYKQIREESRLEDSKVIGNYIRIIMRDKDGRVIENVEDYMKLDGEDEEETNSGSPQPYQAQAGDDIILANMMHNEGCTNGFVSWGYSKEVADKLNMTTGYVLLNRAIVNYSGNGTTIREQLLAPGQYSTAYADLNQSILCMDCYANAKLCLKYDCDYIKNPSGKKMTHDVLGQSGWDLCSNRTELAKNCFWWVDDNFDGIPNEYEGGNKHFDTFFCYNLTYSGK